MISDDLRLAPPSQLTLDCCPKGGFRVIGATSTLAAFTTITEALTFIAREMGHDKVVAVLDAPPVTGRKPERASDWMASQGSASPFGHVVGETLRSVVGGELHLTESGRRRLREAGLADDVARGAITGEHVERGAMTGADVARGSAGGEGKLAGPHAREIQDLTERLIKLEEHAFGPLMHGTYGEAFTSSAAEARVRAGQPGVDMAAEVDRITKIIAETRREARMNLEPMEAMGRNALKAITDLLDIVKGVEKRLTEVEAVITR